MGAQNIYDRFRKAGMTHAGALAMLGNGQCESGLISYRIQGDFSADYYKSRVYTDKVDNGTISRTDFVYRGPGGGGYGLFQWTYYSRKAGLYSFMSQRGVGIGDEDMQVDYAILELKRDWPALWTFLCNTDDLRTAVSNVCYQFENPAVKNVDERLAAARSLEKALVDTEQPNEFWPPRMLDVGMRGADVCALIGLLCAHGFWKEEAGISDEYDAHVKEAVKQFQRQAGLDSDGICGPLTWAALLKI